MNSKEERILKILEEDLLRLEDIHACMVARKNLEGIVPITENFKKEIVGIWDILKNTMDEFFEIIENYSRYGLDKVYFELGEYDVMFFILPRSDTALIAITPALSSRGFIMVELNKAREKIMRILEEE